MLEKLKDLYTARKRNVLAEEREQQGMLLPQIETVARVIGYYSKQLSKLMSMSGSSSPAAATSSISREKAEKLTTLSELCMSKIDEVLRAGIVPSAAG